MGNLNIFFLFLGDVIGVRDIARRKPGGHRCEPVVAAAEIARRFSAGGINYFYFFQSTRKIQRETVLPTASRSVSLHVCLCVCKLRCLNLIYQNRSRKTSSLV